MSDRELLELAAKAIGLKYHAYVDSDMFGRGINTGKLDTPLWNPLTDDGDALRLAVKLNLLVDCSSQCARPLPDDLGWFGGDGGDDCVAMRLAIVRAAAAIGEEMP